MPMTDEELAAYQADLNEKSDEAARAALRASNIGNLPYTAQSMTSTLNKYNQARQSDYLQNLAARQALSQGWHDTATRRATAQAQIAQAERAHERGVAELGLKRGELAMQQEFEPRKMAIQEQTAAETARANRQAEYLKQLDSARRWNMDVGLLRQRQSENEEMRRRWEQEHGLKKEEFSLKKKESGQQSSMAKAQQIFNMLLSKKQITQQDWRDKTDAMLKGLGLQIAQDPIEYARNHPEVNQNMTREQMLQHLANIMKTVSSSNAEEAGIGIAREGQRQAGLRDKYNHAMNVMDAQFKLRNLDAETQRWIYNQIMGFGITAAHGAMTW
jgi:hypothetical protein